MSDTVSNTTTAGPQGAARVRARPGHRRVAIAVAILAVLAAAIALLGPTTAE